MKMKKTIINRYKSGDDKLKIEISNGEIDWLGSISKGDHISISAFNEFVMQIAEVERGIEMRRIAEGERDADG